jgi:macrolide-specific efflux system membrane fusion protein
VIADLDKLVVTANYTEADVVDLKVGQTATVTPNAQSDKTFTAKVASISPTATVTSNVVTYPVTLTLDDTGTGLRDGQTVSANVLVDQADDVLRLPASAVRGTGERGTVTLVTGNGSIQQTVTVGVGLRGDQYLEITSGLSAGDQVVLATVTGNSSQQGGTGPGGQLGGQLGGRQVPDGNGGGFR